MVIAHALRSKAFLDFLLAFWFFYFTINEWVHNQFEIILINLKKRPRSFLTIRSVTKELKFFIQSMISLMDIIVSVLLTKKVRKNSSNSGLPPSQGFCSNGNRNGGNNGEGEKKGGRLPNSRTKKRKWPSLPMNAPIATQISQMPRLSNPRREKRSILFMKSRKPKSAPSAEKETRRSFPKG